MSQQQDELDVINLDAFNLDAMAVEQQTIDVWNPSDSSTAFSQPHNRPLSNLALSMNNNVTDPSLEPRKMSQGYYHHLVFGHYPIRPAPGFQPASTTPLSGAPFPSIPASAFGFPSPTPTASVHQQAPFLSPILPAPALSLAPFAPPTSAAPAPLLAPFALYISAAPASPSTPFAPNTTNPTSTPVPPPNNPTT